MIPLGAKRHDFVAKASNGEEAMLKQSVTSCLKLAAKSIPLQLPIELCNEFNLTLA